MTTGVAVALLTAAIILFEAMVLVNVLIYRRVGREEFCRRELGLLARALVSKLGMCGFLLGATTGPVAIVLCVQLCYCWGGGDVAAFALGVFTAGFMLTFMSDLNVLTELNPEYLRRRAKELLNLAEALEQK